MAYDYQGAISAGANPNDVLKYLGQIHNYNVDGALAAGAKQEDVMVYLSNLPDANVQSAVAKPVTPIQQPSQTPIADIIPHFQPSSTGETNPLKLFGKAALNIPHEVASAVENIVNVPIQGYKTLADTNVQQHPIEAAQGAAQGIYENAIKPVAGALNTMGNTLLGTFQQAIKSATGIDLNDEQARNAYENFVPNLTHAVVGLQSSLVTNPLATTAMVTQPFQSAMPKGVDIVSSTANKAIDLTKKTGTEVKNIATDINNVAKPITQPVVENIVKPGKQFINREVVNPAKGLVTPTFEENLNKAFPVLKRDVNNMSTKVKDVQTALSDIVKNKESTGILDKNGTPKNPSNYSFFETEQAQAGRLKQVYTDYTNKLSTVDKTKFENDIYQNVFDQMDKIKSQIQTENSLDGRRALSGIYKELSTLKDLSPLGIQNYIESIGQRTKTAPGHPPTTKQIKLANLGGEMKKVLDSSIEKIGGTGYQDLRSVYKAHKTLQPQLLQAAKSELNKTPGWTDRMANLGLTAEGINFLMTHDPQALAVGLGIKGSTMFTKWLRSPKRALSNMFKEIEKSQIPPRSPVTINQTANIVPKKSNIQKTIPQNEIKSKTGQVQKTVQKFKETPGKQGGYIKLPSGKIAKQIDEATKREIDRVVDYLKGKEPYNASIEKDIVKLAEKYEVNLDVSNAKLAQRFMDLNNKTKTGALFQKEKSPLLSQAQKAVQEGKTMEEFVKAQQEGNLYHGASMDLGDNPTLKRGYGFGDAGKYTGQDYGGIFFTPSEKYATQYASDAKALYSYKLTGKEKIFDISNPNAVKQFIDNAKNWEDYSSPKIATESAKRIIQNIKETAQHGAADWATVAGFEKELEMSGFHGAKLLERAGENIEPLADGSFKVSGKPVYSYGLFKGDIPVQRAITRSQLEALYNQAKRGDKLTK